MSIQQTVRMYITAFQHWLCSSPSRLEVWDVTHTFHGSLDRGKRWESERKKAEVAAVLTGVVLTDVRFGGCGGADPAEHWQSGLWVLRPQHWPHPHPATSARAACAGPPHCEFCVSCLLSLPSCFLSVSCLLFPVSLFLFPASCFLSPISSLMFPLSCLVSFVSQGERRDRVQSKWIMYNCFITSFKFIMFYHILFHLTWKQCCKHAAFIYLWLDVDCC